jgi:3-phenylpropionate/cinnamic acid dioxygenase small subunit
MGRADPAVEADLTRFLYEEARLLDEQRLREWLDLLADDIRYYMPVQERVERQDRISSPADGLTFDLFDDDKPSLVMRVERIETGFAYSELPASVTHHLITNVEADRTDRADEFVVRSKFIVFQMRPGRYDGHESMFVGDRIDVIRRTADVWKIARRTVRIAHQVLPRAISILF